MAHVNTALAGACLAAPPVTEGRSSLDDLRALPWLPWLSAAALGSTSICVQGSFWLEAASCLHPSRE
jgi:hypothetical protein